MNYYDFKIIVMFFCLVSCTSSDLKINTNYNIESTYELQSVEYLRFQPPEEVGSYRTLNNIQYLENGNGQYFVFFDKSKNMIYWMEYPTGKVIEDKTIQFAIPRKSNLWNYALSSDSVFVFDYGRICTFYILDAHGSIKSEYDLGTNKGAIIGNDWMPYRIGADLLLVSCGIDEISIQRENIFSCYVLNMESKEFRPVPIVDLPTEYYKYHWGNGQMRIVFAEACYPLNSILYSFPASHEIHVYDVNEQKVKKYDGGSSLIEKIQPYGSKKTVNAAEKVDYLNYFFEQPSYYKVIYDPHRSLYYRFAGLPSEKFDVKHEKTYTKKLSVIILDNNFRFLGETLLDEQHSPFDAFVNEKGLHILVRNEFIDGNFVENTITWHVFEPQKISQ